MIPAPIIAEAREAFDSNSDWIGGFEAALAVLSRHWPAADGRLREAAVALLRHIDHTPYRDAAGLRLSDVVPVVEDLRAALSTPAPADTSVWDAAAASVRREGYGSRYSHFAPAENVRVVRVAVAEDARGFVETAVIRALGREDNAWANLEEFYPVRLGIGVLEFPIRDVPVVRASVTEVDHG